MGRVHRLTEKKKNVNAQYMILGFVLTHVCLSIWVWQESNGDDWSW